MVNKNWSLLRILLLVFIAGYSDAATAAHSKAGEDHYDFSKEKVIKDLGTFTITIGNNKIVFDAVHGNVTDQQLYDRNDANFNFDNVYKVTDKTGAWYFRFAWQNFSDSRSVFSNVKWLSGKEPVSGTYQISVVKLELVQKGSISVCTIGDSQTWWDKAGELRSFINSEAEELFFVGSRTDFNGYPHEGEGGNNTSQVLKRLSYIPRADYYTLLLGTNDWRGNLDTAKSNILKITAGLLAKYPGSKIVYITPLPTSNKVRDAFNTTLKTQLLAEFADNKNILVTDAGGKMRENPEWLEEFFSSDGLHQNTDGVRLMAIMIAKQIREDR